MRCLGERACHILKSTLSGGRFPFLSTHDPFTNLYPLGQRLDFLFSRLEEVERLALGDTRLGWKSSYIWNPGPSVSTLANRLTGEERRVPPLPGERVDTEGRDAPLFRRVPPLPGVKVDTEGRDAPLFRRVPPLLGDPGAPVPRPPEPKSFRGAKGI
jgi:hypothetical protein